MHAFLSLTAPILRKIGEKIIQLGPIFQILGGIPPYNSLSIEELKPQFSELFLSTFNKLSEWDFIRNVRISQR